MYNDGYKYWLAYKKKNTRYYRCARYKTNCPGRCVVEDDIVRNTTQHNHSPEPDRVLVDKFRKTLTYRASTETTELYDIYWDEAIQRHADASLLYTFASAESAMRKARRKQLPPVPNTIMELGDVLAKSNLFRIHSGPNKDKFYQTTLTISDTTCLIFLHRKTLQLLGRIDEMHVDVSFDIKPTTQPQYHLLIAHCVQTYTSIPFMFAVMSDKNQTAFAAIFAYMRENYAAQIVPNVIISNFDADIQQALALTFPEATIKGFWSHYTNAVLNQAQKLELHREVARGHGASFLRMLLVLPLLPAEYLAPGNESLRKWAQEKKEISKEVMTLCLYVEQSWIRNVGAEKMSIFGFAHCVHNHIQHFNKDLESTFGSGNPLIWQMLECITSVATRTFVKAQKRAKSNFSLIIPKKGQRVIESVIKNATQLWVRTPVHLRNPLNFLQLSSHCINDTLYYSNLNERRKVRNGDTQERKNVAATTTSQSVNILGTFSIPTSNYMSMNGQSYKVIAQSPCTKTGSSNFFATFGGSQPQQQNHIRTMGQVQHQQQQSFSVCEVINKISVPQSDPPPLAFFPKIVPPLVARHKQYSSSEPPPLVPIGLGK